MKALEPTKRKKKQLTTVSKPGYLFFYPWIMLWRISRWSGWNTFQLIAVSTYLHDSFTLFQNRRILRSECGVLKTRFDRKQDVL